MTLLTFWDTLYKWHCRKLIWGRFEGTFGLFCEVLGKLTLPPLVWSLEEYFPDPQDEPTGGLTKWQERAGPQPGSQMLEEIKIFRLSDLL